MHAFISFPFLSSLVCFLSLSLSLMTVIGGVVVLELSTGRILWSSHLDLTTDHTTLKANIYASPTVVMLPASPPLLPPSFQQQQQQQQQQKKKKEKAGQEAVETLGQKETLQSSSSSSSSPGELSIVVGTALGFVWVMRADDGVVRPGFPASAPLAEIQAQVIAEDVNGDGAIGLPATAFSSSCIS